MNRCLNIEIKYFLVLFQPDRTITLRYAEPPYHE